MKKLYLALLLIFVVGCTKVINPVEIAQKDEQVQQLLSEYPDADIEYSKTNFIDERCLIPQKEYYRITIDTEGEDLVVYTDEKQVYCVYKVREVEKQPEEQVVNTTLEVKGISNFKIEAETKGVNTRIIKSVITDDNIADSFILSFDVECQEWRVNPLKIYLDDEKIYDEVPDCGSNVEVDISNITQGSYDLKFQTDFGTYQFSNVDYPGISLTEFKITTESENIILAEYDEIAIGEEKYFSVEQELKEAILTFDTSVQGIMFIILNNRTILNREIITPPNIRLKDLLEEENTIRFEIGEYPEKCNDISLELYEHNDQQILCKVPNRDRIQMIFKNNGNEVIDNVDFFVIGESTVVDNLNLDLEPGQIFTRVIDYEDIGDIEEVILTPVMEDATRCRSISFKEINECE